MARVQQGFPVYATSSGNVVATASCGGGANGVINFAAPSTVGTATNYLSDVVWSYSTTPSTGRLTVYDGTSSGAIILQVDINGMGPDTLRLNAPLAGTPGRAMAVELLQAGSSIIGRLNAYGFKT